MILEHISKWFGHVHWSSNLYLQTWGECGYSLAEIFIFFLKLPDLVQSVYTAMDFRVWFVGWRIFPTRIDDFVVSSDMIWQSLPTNTSTIFMTSLKYQMTTLVKPELRKLKHFHLSSQSVSPYMNEKKVLATKVLPRSP